MLPAQFSDKSRSPCTPTATCPLCLSSRVFGLWGSHQSPMSMLTETPGCIPGSCSLQSLSTLCLCRPLLQRCGNSLASFRLQLPSPASLWRPFLFQHRASPHIALVRCPWFTSADWDISIHPAQQCGSEFRLPVEQEFGNLWFVMKAGRKI